MRKERARERERIRRASNCLPSLSLSLSSSSSSHIFLTYLCCVIKKEPFEILGWRCLFPRSRCCRKSLVSGARRDNVLEAEASLA